MKLLDFSYLFNNKYIARDTNDNINLDNAATTKPFNCVIDNVLKYSEKYGSVDRGHGSNSEFNNYIFSHGKDVILKFLNAPKELFDVIYVKNTTEGINRLSYRMINKNSKVLTTLMEHHANDLPWRFRSKLRYVNLLDNGRLDLYDLERKLKFGNFEIFTCTGASNVTGYINNLDYISFLCHKYNTKLIIDGAQLIPHKSVDISRLLSKGRLDAIVFSGHKTYAPFDIGAIVIKKNIFKNLFPDYLGGGAVEIVTEDKVIFKSGISKEEPGTPNMFGIIAIISSLEQLMKIGMDKVFKHEQDLLKHTIKKMNSIPFIKLYGENFFSSNRLAIIPFNVCNIFHEVIAKKLADKNISTRNGCFCSHIYIAKLLNLSKEEVYEITKSDPKNKPGMIRISFALYTTKKEIDYFLNILNELVSY